jgi:GT2 family glycosyltransferase
VAADLELAVVIPAHDAARYLPRALGALPPGLPVVVVDDASTDDTAACAAALGARVLRLPAQGGPAAARNAGVAALDAEVVLFLDADCVAHAGVPARVRAAFAADPGLVGLSGSYDAEPPERGFFSRYMNLRHHYTHQSAPPDTRSFWAGCGAVRRRAFLAAGGFDARRYPAPAIEDVELAVRLGREGALRFDPALQVTHLKRWSLLSLVDTEIRRRAIPWARLVAQEPGAPRALNLRVAQRVAVVLAPLALAALAVVPWSLASGRHLPLAVLCLGALAGAAALSAPMLAAFARQAGAGFAARAFWFHQLHLVYAGAAFAAAFALERWRMRRARASPRRGSGPQDEAAGDDGAERERERGEAERRPAAP